MDDYYVSRTMQTLLPTISGAVINRIRVDTPDFETLYRKFRNTNPEAALWLLSAAEQLAPADPGEKERYATLALELFYMLYEQTLTNRLLYSYEDSFNSHNDELAHDEQTMGE